MEIWYACSTFSSIFCLPETFSGTSPHPTNCPSRDISSTSLCTHIVVQFALVKSHSLVSTAGVTRCHHQGRQLSRIGRRTHSLANQMRVSDFACHWCSFSNLWKKLSTHAFVMLGFDGREWGWNQSFSPPLRLQTYFNCWIMNHVSDL